ncbi:hypothetical protein CCM_05150 [Cordyceps militaris CM01]|uniref:Uncharacterized protein n=1 Tax=Cordyceps militaris (strain CM01) TaxID=983644 RepID=G3JI40_CORMM|nr:uncharacterized protein CCM_05150 [Cordyceps militaris CM01]EGX90993.1 hypothetical protein CCM_05150 [Cordyceps militaris CM01]
MPGRISELIYQIGTTIEIVRWIEVASPHRILGLSSYSNNPGFVLSNNSITNSRPLTTQRARGECSHRRGLKGSYMNCLQVAWELCIQSEGSSHHL